MENKNIRPLAGHPLIAYSIAAALESEVFEEVLVSTDSPAYAEVARYYGADVPFLRPSEYATAKSPDIEWVEHLLIRRRDEGKTDDCFSILRPTSPFRSADTIRRAWQRFLSLEGVDSMRAVEACGQHPAKMWVVSGDRMEPLLPQDPLAPLHSRQYQSLPKVFVQNASLEIAWTRVVFETHTIAGRIVAPFFTEGLEGFDVNTPMDWRIAEELVAAGEARLPRIEQEPHPNGKEQ